MLGLDCDYYRRGCLSLFCASAVQHADAGPGVQDCMGEQSERARSQIIDARSTAYTVGRPSCYCRPVVVALLRANDA